MDNKFDLKDLISDANRPAHKVNCFKCGKEFMSQHLFKNIACYVCAECSRKEYEEHPISRKDLLSEDGIKVLRDFEEVCNQDLTDADFRRAINSIVNDYNSLIPPDISLEWVKPYQEN